MSAGHLLCPQGIAGDMLLGALVDAGAPLSRLQAAVDAVGAAGLGPIGLRHERVTVGGAPAARIHVEVAPSAGRVETWPAARELLAAAALDDRVRELALAAHRRLAEAEAAVHGRDPETVRYHELGHPDTTADLVGACAGVVALGLTGLTCGPVAVGGGTVRTGHGELAVPAPAVAELLRGFAVHAGGHRELATPTGAALLATLARPAADGAWLVLRGHGRGAGDLDRPDPSVTTLLVGDPAGGATR